MPNQPPYFDSQAQAAAVLKLDICELREAKREGCPAFRSGRVYSGPLLAWLAEKNRQRSRLENEEIANATMKKSLANGSEKAPELPKSHWDRKKAQLDYERALYRFEVEQQKYLPLDDITVAVGQILVGFRTALNMLPAGAARWLVGLRDFHAIKDKLQSEVDAVLQTLGRCDYLAEDLVPTIVAELFSDRDTGFRAHIAHCCHALYREIGNRVLSDLVQRQLPKVNNQSERAGSRIHHDHRTRDSDAISVGSKAAVT